MSTCAHLLDSRLSDPPMLVPRVNLFATHSHPCGHGAEKPAADTEGTLLGNSSVGVGHGMGTAGTNPAASAHKA